MTSGTRRRLIYTIDGNSLMNEYPWMIT